MISFVNGYASFVLGDNSGVISPNDFAVKDPYFLLTVRPKDNEDDMTVHFPIPSTPYALHALEADYAHRIDAGTVIDGTFGSVSVNGVLKVFDENDDFVLFVSTENRNVGIRRLPSSEYTLDVSGSINASDYLIDGQGFEERFAWKKDNNDLYYEGNVGIGKKPSSDYTLDVSGNINAKVFFVNKRNLIEELNANAVWLPGSKVGEIYWKGPSGVLSKVGIGVSQDLIPKYDAVDLVKIASSILGGKGGGGRKDFAQAGGSNKNKIEDAFKALNKKII